MEKRRKFRRVVPDNIKVEDITPLDITCGATKCNDGLHCFSLKKSSIKKQKKERVCYQCGEDLIEWKRVHKNNIKDAEFTFQSMKENELIRYVFWNSKIDDSAILFAQERGRIAIHSKAKKLIKGRIGKYTPFIDGRQTPVSGSEIIDFAQHGTATCCRKCLEAWHNIPMEMVLTEQQLDYCTNLVMLYVDQRVPNLK